MWVGAVNGMEQRLVSHAGIAYRGIATGQLRGKNPLTVARNAGKMIAGFLESLAIVREFRPDVCLATGGYVCAPVVAACRLQGIPVMIYLPDMVPGWAIRSLGILAQRVAVTFPEVAHYFGGVYPSGKSVVTGYPVRQDLVAAVGGGALAPADHAEHRRAARIALAKALDLCFDTNAGTNAESALPFILVWGGSQGSLNINNATWQALPTLLPHAQILHVVGNRDWAMWQQRMQTPPVAAALWAHYHPIAYLHEEMALALAAADLTVARAGASTLGEFPVARLPALLAPHPGVNQRQNAEYLVEHGGAVMVDDRELSQRLTPLLLALLEQPEQRQQMEAALAQLAMPQAARAIADALSTLVQTQQER
ncbi:MAG TPA: glycosyltransferase [Caldilineaceae bacterium]|nr:glycosyltransferase [Caldilineaceae bacterium]